MARHSLVLTNYVFCNKTSPSDDVSLVICKTAVNFRYLMDHFRANTNKEKSGEERLPLPPYALTFKKKS
jgi:hypothetical protein